MVIEKLCTKCKTTKPNEDFNIRKSKLGLMSWCKLCKKEQTQQKRLNHISTGKCKVCSNERLKGSSLCSFHLVKAICKKDNATTNLLIDKLYAQRFECYYTGTLLLLGVNASIDHIQPLNKQGKDIPENLVWVDFSVNRMKSDTLNTAFFSEYIDQLTEMNYLACIESQQTKLQKLSYVLGSDFALNTIIG